MRVHGLARQLKQGQAEGVFGAFTPEVMAMSIAQAIDGVAAAYAITNTLLQPLNTYLTGRPIGISLRAFGANVAPVVAAGRAVGFAGA